MKHHREPAWICVVCGEESNTATIAIGDSSPPADGDISLCWYCGQAYERRGVTWRTLTPEAEAALDAEDKLNLARAREARLSVFRARWRG